MTRSASGSSAHSLIAGGICSMRALHSRPGDIDIVYVYGYGFPPHLGGPMWYAQENPETSSSSKSDRVVARA